MFPCRRRGAPCTRLILIFGSPFPHGAPRGRASLAFSVRPQSCVPFSAAIALFPSSTLAPGWVMNYQRLPPPRAPAF
jgi:hypothetical protein